MRATARLLRTSAAMLVLAAAPLRAQPDAPPPAQADPKAASVYDLDIVVTARKRQESLLSVPVIEKAIPAAQLDRVQAVDVKDLTKLAPGLLIGTAVLSIGQLVSIRGVGTSSFDPGIDQSVSLNIDGLPLGQGLAYSSGLFDVGQVEVLKGPQALFFGKSSPGGVISIRTADPTDRFELRGSAAYGFDAHTRRGELIVSGPLSDTLKARLAGLYQATKGYYYNDAIPAPGTGALAPRYPRMGRARSYQLRGTLLWEPSDAFSARLKANVARDRTINAEIFQLTSCPDGISAPLGIPFVGGGEDCRKNRTGRIVDMDPASFPGLSTQTPFIRILQRYGTLELNHQFADGLTATSVSSYYNLHSESLLNTSNTTFAGPAFAVENPRFRREDFTQELRLNSDYDGPLNFTLGGFYQDGKVSDLIVLRGNLNYRLPGLLQQGLNRFDIKTYSLYGQARYKLTPELELAAGVRWTDETRRQEQFLDPVLAFPVPGRTLVNSPTPRLHTSNFSPEVTLTYRPSDDLTVFGAYKKGYKSGSFSIATPAKLLSPLTCLSNVATCQYLDNSFGDEKVEGGEAGIKGRLLDRQLTFSLAGYRYTYDGLQVGAIEPTVGAIPTIRTVNAGSGRSYGAELDLTFRPRGVEGLSLNGSLNWNHARFRRLDNVPCYGGQTVAEGCNQQLDPGTGLFFAQDASGSRFVRAPDWQAVAGFDYQLPVGEGMKLTFTNSNQYSARYLTAIGFRDDFFQRRFVKVDLSVSIADADDRWELALIGKNVTKQLTTSSCSPSNFAGGLLGGIVTGGTVRGPAGIDEVGCYMDPGRELWLRLTLRPFK